MSSNSRITLNDNIAFNKTIQACKHASMQLSLRELLKGFSF
jgi:hypothetical protein